MNPQDRKAFFERSSLQAVVNWFMGECYSTYLTEGLFFCNLLSHSYSIEEIKRFAQAFGIYRCRYAKLLGIDVILSSCEREEWKSSALHLLEELGGRGGTKTHGEMYRDFLLELGFFVEEGSVISETEELSFVNDFYEGFETFCKERPTVQRKTILAIFELVDNADYASLHSGLLQYGFSQESLAFFKIHADALHWDDAKSDIEILWQNKDNRSLMIEAFEVLLKLQQDLYDGMHSWIISGDSFRSIRSETFDVVPLFASPAGTH
jgi:hypothetical protein